MAERMNIRECDLKPMHAAEWLHYLSENALSKEELSWLYHSFDYRWLLIDCERLPELTKEMLSLGLDPNCPVTDEYPDEDPEKNFYYIPLIEATGFEDDIAGTESLKILLEHGGDPNTMYSFGDPDENVFEFYVEDEFANAPDMKPSRFYGMILCAAYGGKNHSNGDIPFTMLIDAPITIFKDCYRYWYEYVDGENYSSTMYVIEKDTGKRIARYH